MNYLKRNYDIVKYKNKFRLNKTKLAQFKKGFRLTIYEIMLFFEQTRGNRVFYAFLALLFYYKYDRMRTQLFYLELKGFYFPVFLFKNINKNQTNYQLEKFDKESENRLDISFKLLDY